MIRDTFPSTAEFYKTYWGKKPFIVRQAIAPETFDTLIDSDHLAGLSLEDDIKSRIVITNSDSSDWTCHHGPFPDDHFASLGETNWSLLVQNVEQYHTDTAALLQEFHFAPRWLMDDIMVSYSTAGGSVGPHTDSYHVFLVQGMGKRKWTIGHTAIQNEDCIDGLDLKVLKDGVNGQEIEVTIGDIIYLPPHFAHEGITIENALTFSVGFLGPQLSEILGEYGHYLQQQDQNNQRYSGQGLDTQSAAFTIAPQAQKTLQENLITAIQSDDFAIWLAEYFSTPTHDDVENLPLRETPLSSAQLLEHLQKGQTLYKPDHIKLSITTSSKGTRNIAAYGETIPSKPADGPLIDWLNQNKAIAMQDLETLGNPHDLLTDLYNQNVLEFLTH